MIQRLKSYEVLISQNAKLARIFAPIWFNALITRQEFHQYICE